MDSSKPSPDPKDYHEGPKAAKAFEGLLKRALSTSHEEIERRHKAWDKERKSSRKKAR